jgi:hypothetical protein
MCKRFKISMIISIGVYEKFLKNRILQTRYIKKHSFSIKR